ncbi:MAG: hypothetical protein IJ144_06050 [Prevotella sp.]|nr:hypothetical protein [Prevotella sp.]
MKRTTVNYRERKNFVKYDEKHVLLYLNEQPAEITDDESGETVQGYSYTGTMDDGGTLIEAEDVTDENRRSKFISGLIGTEYDIDEQIAILANGDDTNEHAEEKAVFMANRQTVKTAIDELLARNI